MSVSFKKEFKDFELGMGELLERVPDIKYYTGDTIDQKQAIIHLIYLIRDDIPLVTNENYPNTFSLTISAREVGFKTDDNLAFGWRVWLDKNTNKILGYQFRVTFINLSRNRKGIAEELISNGWKERSSDEVQSKFWEEINTTPRSFSEKESNKPEEDFSTDEDTDVQDVSSSDEEDYSQLNLLPTFNHVDEATEDDISNVQEEEPIKEEQHLPRLGLRRSMGKYANYIHNMDEEESETETQDEDEPQQEPIVEVIDKPKPRLGLLGRSLKKRTVIEVEDAEQGEPIAEDVHEMAEAQTILETPKQVILPNGKVTASSQYIQEMSTGLVQLDPNQYNIRPTDRPDQVIITFEGDEVPINVNESHRGIIRDPANKKLIIDTVVYDYKSFTVFGLPENYKPDQALHVSGTSNMIEHGALPDEMFVPQETIMKNSDVNIEAIREEAIKRENFHTKMTGVRPSINWNRGNLGNPRNNSGNVLKRGRGFVIDRTPSIPKDDNTGQTQSVQITNEEGSMFEGRGKRW